MNVISFAGIWSESEASGELKFDCATGKVRGSSSPSRRVMNAYKIVVKTFLKKTKMST